MGTSRKPAYTETYYDEVDRFLNEWRRSPWDGSLGNVPQEEGGQIGAAGWVEVLDTDGTVIVEINQNGMTWAHHPTHENGGTDEIDLTGLSGISAELALHLADATDAHDAAAISLADAGGNTTETDVEGAIDELYGLVGGIVVITDHGGLTGLADDDHPQYATNVEFDDHSARHENGGADEISVAGLSGLLADQQTPLAHAASHSDAGGDEIDILDLAGYPGGTTDFLRADGSFATPAGGGGSLTIEAIANVDNIDLLPGLQLTNLGSGDIQLRIHYLDNETLNFGTSTDYTIAYNSSTTGLEIVGPSAAAGYLWLKSGGGVGDGVGLIAQLDGATTYSISLGVASTGVPSLHFGDGSGTVDVQLTRGAANKLQLVAGDSFEIVQGDLILTNANSNIVLDTTTIDQSAPGTLRIDNASGISITGGAITLEGDVAFSRTAADVLTLAAGDTFVADTVLLSGGRVWRMSMTVDTVVNSNSTLTTLAFARADVDDGNSVINLANDTFDIQEDGTYRIDFFWSTTSNPPVAGDRTEIQVNGGSILNCTLFGTAVNGSTYHWSTVAELSAGDIVRFQGFTTSQPTNWRGSASLSLSTGAILTRLN